MNPITSIRPTIRDQDKTTGEHPWAHRIKNAYLQKIRYAHNSIRNPKYPKKEEKILPDVKRTKFTVIGDRVTKEFIYCVNLVKGLYKYRKNIFEAPVIQGVTTVEWTTILNDLKARYKEPAFCLTSSVAVLINKEFLGGDKELRNLIESKFIYNLCLDYPKESIAELANFIRGSGRDCAYMNIAFDGKPVGSLIFMLYADVLPQTCANFVRLCKETRGGYSGTTIHRIVKDGWIQGGGFGLKETDLNCENFIIPHDRRGVLCMANSGLHMECSTQFFILLQPAPWMAKKFVAFGQLIEGKGTLDKIEAVPTWYESPTSEITIYKAGIFNIDCHYIIINNGTNEYIDKHIEDLNELGDLLYENLIEKVFLTAQLRDLERLKEQQGEGSEQEEDANAGLRETKRFNRRKEDIEKQLETSKLDSPLISVARSAALTNENNDFDVETYEPEYEETDQSVHPPSLIVKPRKPFHLPLTDVLYPGEKSSEFDLKRFLQGDYCLESDLKVPAKTFIPRSNRLSYLSYQVEVESDSEDHDSDDVSNEDREIKQYFKNNVDRVSFAGGIVKKIGKAKPMFNLFEGTRKSELITDDQLRRLRLASTDMKNLGQHDKKVRIVPDTEETTPAHAIKRRPTAFVRHNFVTEENDDEDDYKVSPPQTPASLEIRVTQLKEKLPITFADPETIQKHPIALASQEATKKRPRAFAPSIVIIDDDDDVGKTDDYHTGIRESVLLKLFEEWTRDDDPPTLKDYKPISETHARNILMISSNYLIKSEPESNRDRFLRQSFMAEKDSYEQKLDFQHGKKVARKISSDYAKTIDQIEHRLKSSIRSIEYAKSRPTISVSEYQRKNREYQEAKKKIA